MSFARAVERKESVRDKYSKSVRSNTLERNEVETGKRKPSFAPFENFLFNAPNDVDTVRDFKEMYKEHPIYALRMALWLRDARGGGGRRKGFREILNFLNSQKFQKEEKFVRAIPEVGRYDDLIQLENQELKEYAFQLLEDHLNDPSKSGLAAKWLPRDTSNRLNLTPKQYRKMLVELTDVVETLMCANRWDEIEYEKLPSQAAARYQKAFMRHSPRRYQEYLNRVEEGEFKINADVLLPHEVFKSLNDGDARAANLQWKALPDYGDQKILPIIDVSASMTWATGAGRLQLLDIAIMLGIYFSEKNTSDLKDCFIAFSSEPTISKLKEDTDITRRHRQVARSTWTGSTNLDKVFRKLLDFAKNHDLSNDDLPDYLVVISDMEFNGPAFRWDRELYERIATAYNNAGYEMPGLIWWNLNSTRMPSQPNIDNTYCVGGSSPEIIKSVLKGNVRTTRDVIMEIVEGDRYKQLY